MKSATSYHTSPTEELSGLVETTHLLRSGTNAIRLVSALREARSGELKPSSVPALRREFGLEKG